MCLECYKMSKYGYSKKTVLCNECKKKICKTAV